MLSKTIELLCSNYTELMSNHSINMISGFKENNGDRTVIKDVDPNAIEILVNYIYSTYEIKNVITGDNVQDLLAAANLLQLWEVKEECCKFMLNGLDLTNCFNIKSVAKGYDCPKLLATTNQYIGTNFKKIVDTSEFYGLEHQQLPQCCAPSEQAPGPPVVPVLVPHQQALMR